MDDQNLFDAINDKVNVDRVGVSKGKHGDTSESFPQKMLISTEASKRTVQHTTQQGIRTILHPSLSLLFKTNE